MIQIACFVFNPFSENTYLLHDETGECVVIDPGCYEKEEKETLASYINNNSLKPVKLLLTHSHIDHILGCNYLCGKYGLDIYLHRQDEAMLSAAPALGQMWGITAEPAPAPSHYLSEGDEVRFGNSVLSVLFTPGHSPGSVSFCNHKQKFIIAGDVLFRESIGRTDLPGGNHQILLNSIRDKLFTLPDDYKVLSGHGPETSIGYEKIHNPFLST